MRKFEPSESDCLSIIEDYKNKISSSVLAEKFGVSTATICAFLRRNNIEVAKYSKVKGERIDVLASPGGSKGNDFYVYFHRNITDNSIFYVGKGRGDRYRSRHGRSKEWHKVTINGYIPEFYKTCLSETEALILEKELISNTSNLINTRILNSVPFSKDDYSEYFQIDSSSPSRLTRIKTSPNLGGTKASLGNAGHISVYSGKPYWKIKFKGYSLAVHRIIWTLTNGIIPDNLFIDHIDGDSLNNDIDNLRLVSKPENSRNLRKRCDNTTGITGVAYKTATRQYVASVMDNDKKISRSFSISKYGLIPALYSACQWRQEQLVSLNKNGAGYHYTHGT